MDAVRPDEHAAAEADNFFSIFINVMDRICIRAEAARGNPPRAAVGRPHGYAITVNRYAVGASPFASVYVAPRPIEDGAIRVITLIDRRNVGCLGQAQRNGHRQGNCRK